MKNKSTECGFVDGAITHFKDRLKLAMKDESNLSLSKRANMSDKVIRDYLNGLTTPSLERLEVLAKVLNCSVAWLAAGVGASEVTNKVNEPAPEYVARKDSELTDAASKIDAITFLLKKLSDEDQEKIINQIVNSGVKSLVPNEISQRALAISNLILTLSDEDQREILLLIEGKKLDTLLNNKQKNRMAG